MFKNILTLIVSLSIAGCASSGIDPSSKLSSLSSIFTTCSDCKQRKYDYKEKIASIRANAARELSRKTILSVAPIGEDKEGDEFLTMSK